MQAFFSAAVKVVLRILGKTESTHVMMFYMGGESFLLAAVLCAAIPNMFRLPKSGFESVLLIFTGEPSETERLAQTRQALLDLVA